MQTLLIVGLDSVVGSNLAASLSDRYSVVGLWQQEPVALDGCAVSACPDETGGTARNWVATVRPDWIVYCGPAAQSAWQRPLFTRSDRFGIDAAGNWAGAAREFGCRFTMISSDAVFTGPWLFHSETSRCYCPTPQARTLRAAEEEVIENCPDPLVVRTHAFGWSSETGSGTGWLEEVLGELEEAHPHPRNSFSHATPILATDLALILERAYRAGLSGVFHVAGAERVNPHQFVQRLADRFELPVPRSPEPQPLFEGSVGFGEGETSLRCRKIRKALGLALPMLDEGLSRLLDQQDNGYRDRLQSAAEPVNQKVA